MSRQLKLSLAINDLANARERLREVVGVEGESYEWDDAFEHIDRAMSRINDKQRYL